MVKTTTALALGALALAVGVLVTVLVMVGSSGPEESPERRAARDQARTEARYYCSLSVSSIDAPEFKSCVQRETRDAMTAWDREHPEG